MCSPRPIPPYPAATEAYAPPTLRNAKREFRRARARKNAIAVRIADRLLFSGEPAPASLLSDYAAARSDARRAELRVKAVGALNPEHLTQTQAK